MVSGAVSFEVAAWDERAVTDLCLIGDASARLADWREAVREGRAQIWAVLAGGKRVGSVVWEVAWKSGDPELWVLAAGSQPVPGADVTQTIRETFEGLRDLVGAKRVLCETERPGMARKLAGAGCEVAQIGARRWRVAA